MNNSQIIKKAILSEKSYQLIESGLYIFLVDKKSTKDEIARAVEKQFSVSVKGVNVLNKVGKTKRIYKTRKTTLVGRGKKAIVALEKGQTIALFTTEKDKNKNKKTDKKINKTVSSAKDQKKEKAKGIFSRFRKNKTEEGK